MGTKIRLLISILGLCLGSCGLDRADWAGSIPEARRAQAEVGKEPRVLKGDKVWVYKYDGTLQCEMGDEISLATMKRELQGIEVYREEKRSDGQMRIQMCGSPTGRANLYEIAETDVEKAKEKGFEPWPFN